MSQELLRAVMDQPDDDGPRLAYAAWSEGQASPAQQARAEFIRGQIKLARSGQEFRITAAGQLLAGRVEGLEQRFGREWTPPAIARNAQATLHIRGFIEFVRLPARVLLENGAEIFESAPIRHLDFTHVRDVDERLFASPYLKRLVSLGLNSCGLYGIHIRLLIASGGIANLRWLSLQSNHLDLSAAEAIASSPYSNTLKYVEFAGNPVDPGEQLGWDAGAIVFSSMPDEGEELERRFGPLPWLHRQDGPPSRFDV